MCLDSSIMMPFFLKINLKNHHMFFSYTKFTYQNDKCFNGPCPISWHKAHT